MFNASSSEVAPRITYLLYPQWGLLWLIIGGAVLLVLGLAVRVLTGLSVASDMVFAVEALIAGIAADQVFRRFLHRKLVMAPKVEIPIIYIWPVLCLYVFVVRPFE